MSSSVRLSLRGTGERRPEEDSGMESGSAAHRESGGAATRAPERAGCYVYCIGQADEER